MKYFYSDYPLEQAAFDHVVEASERIQRLLEQEPTNTLTTAIAGHRYWLADGDLVASPSAPGDGTAPSEEDINDAFTIHDIDGIGVAELHDIVRDSVRWLANPKFIKIPEGSPLSSEQRRKMAELFPTPKPCAVDRRQGFALGRVLALEPVCEPSITVALRYDSTTWNAQIVAIDGEELAQPRGYDEEVNARMTQLGYQVIAITLATPYVDVLGRPSAFKPGQLSQNDLALYLLKNMGLTPFFRTTFGDTVASTYSLQSDSYSVTVAVKIPSSAKDWVLSLPKH